MLPIKFYFEIVKHIFDFIWNEPIILISSQPFSDISFFLKDKTDNINVILFKLLFFILLIDKYIQSRFLISINHRPNHSGIQPGLTKARKKQCKVTY